MVQIKNILINSRSDGVIHFFLLSQLSTFKSYAVKHDAIAQKKKKIITNQQKNPQIKMSDEKKESKRK